MIPSGPLSVLVLSPDADLPLKLKDELEGAAITVAKDVHAIPRPAAKRGFDAVIVEIQRQAFRLDELGHLAATVDPGHALVLAGPPQALQHASILLRAIRSNGRGRSGARLNPEGSFEGYLESKLADFVREMKSSRARNVHTMLIKAVERPLIALALKETNGNQIQAAQLLGMNRNTLRKKIADLRIPVRRESTRKRPR